MKKTILHFIYDLGRGGAETMLVRVLKELPEYNNIVVTLYPDNHFQQELQCDQYICLNQRSLFLFPFYAIKLRRIIKKYNVDIVHTHLFWPTQIARLGVPKKIPLVTTIHAFIASSVEYKIWYIRLIDRFSYRLRKTIIIGVAKGATKEYFSFLKIKPFKSYALYTFVDTAQFHIAHDATQEDESVFRLISIGALRVQKNHQYLIEAFKLLKGKNIELHIYGIGPLEQKLQKLISETGVRVILKGQVKNLNEILPRYSLCVMSSTFEGFSLGVLETMAAKVPMLLSDIVSFHEQCEETAMYFSLDDTNDFATKVKKLAADKELRLKLSNDAYKRVFSKFTLQHHMDELRKIYIETLKENY